jgi:integrase
MHHAKHSPSIRQTVLVLRILNLRLPNKPMETRLSLYENRRPQAGVRNLPYVAQGRAESAQRQVSVDAAREVIAQGVSDIFTAANVESLESATIKEWCDKWLETKSIEAEQSTHDRYNRIVQRFLEGIGTKANRDLSTLHTNDIARFRDREAKERARATANLSLKVMRVCLGEAKRQELIVRNPAESVKLLKSAKESRRRAFRLPEIKRILKACGENVGWRGLILFGLYIGQRLGDLAKLTWRAIDLDSGEIAFTARKTGRRIILPLVQPLIDYLSALPSSDNPNAYIFPNAAAHKRTNSLSNQFRDIMADAGLVEPHSHEKTKQGRSSAREQSELSFHSLRHSAVTMLKAAGVSDFIAREIVGHESAAVSRQYTHLTTDDKRAAMQRMPDVTNG